MQAQDLIKHLYHQDSKIRYKCILIVGMVEETLALDTLHQRMMNEPEAHIKKAIRWAGQRLESAKTNGQSTINTIFDYYKINHELASSVSPEEAELMRKMQQQLDAQLRQMQKDSNDQRGKLALGSALGGALIGGVGVGASQASSILNTSSMQMDKNSQSEQPALRIPPTQISDADISQLVKRLINETDSEKQRKSALSLGDINNPAALPYLALTVYQHPDADVRTAAETAGKRIYWNYNYLTMEQDGRLDAEIAKRRQEFDAGLRQKPQEKSKAVQATPQDDLSAILDRAQKKRKRRNK